MLHYQLYWSASWRVIASIPIMSTEGEQDHEGSTSRFSDLIAALRAEERRELEENKRAFWDEFKPFVTRELLDGVVVYRFRRFNLRTRALICKIIMSEVGEMGAFVERIETNCDGSTIVHITEDINNSLRERYSATMARNKVIRDEHDAATVAYYSSLMNRSLWDHMFGTPPKQPVLKTIRMSDIEIYSCNDAYSF